MATESAMPSEEEASVETESSDSEAEGVASAAPSRTKRAASASSGSSIVIVTSARPMGGRFAVPLKMQSDMRSARRDLWLCSPRTQLIASTTLDLPQPLGPTMQVVPVPLNVTTVRSQKDLKPTISTLRSFSKVSPFVVKLALRDRVPHILRLDAGTRGPGSGARRETTYLSSRGGSSQQRFPPVRYRNHTRLAGSLSEPSRLALRMAVRDRSVA